MHWPWGGGVGNAQPPIVSLPSWLASIGTGWDGPNQLGGTPPVHKCVHRVSSDYIKKHSAIKRFYSHIVAKMWRKRSHPNNRPSHRRTALVIWNCFLPSVFEFFFWYLVTFLFTWLLSPFPWVQILWFIEFVIFLAWYWPYSDVLLSLGCTHDLDLYNQNISYPWCECLFKGHTYDPTKPMDC